jgi:hypothetical protein
MGKDGKMGMRMRKMMRMKRRKRMNPRKIQLWRNKIKFGDV